MGIAARFAASALFITVAFPALAGPSTEDGARKLTAAFQTYLTDTPGVVTVSPTGEGYRLVIDAAPLAAKAGSGDAFRMTPLEMELTDRGDGTWEVTQDQPFSLKVTLPGEAEIDLSMARATMEGVWDQDLMTFSAYTGSAEGVDYVTVTPEEAGGAAASGPVRQVQRIESMTFRGTGAANPTGGVDVTQTFDASGLTQTMPILVEPGAAPFEVGVTVGTYTGDTKIEGLRVGEMLALVAFFVRNPSQASVTAAQEELRAGLKALMPGLDHMDGTIRLRDINAGTPVGEVGLDTIDVTVEAKGAVADGLLREAVRFDGLSLPAGLVPEWAVQLVPQSGSFDVAGSGFDLATVAARAIAEFDLKKTPPLPASFEDSMAAMILPEGMATITLAPGSVSGPLLNLTWEGQMQVGPGSQMPVGTAKITAKGLNEVRQALTAAPPEMGGPASMGIGAAVAVGKTEADGTVVWEIEASETGEVRINGRLMPMPAQ